MWLAAEFCTKNRTKRSESVVGGGVLYEKSYKGARMHVEAEICTKYRTKWSEYACREAVLCEKSYKIERKCGWRRSFVRKIVQRGAKEWPAAEICTKNRAKWAEV
ncbi:hypothetical protein D3P08_21640 [Paenibacillus nanensis]|uniref:Uncharacterized protein n=1 Tax=Paenibacillus nanensis TaxID=393251 RepID=A0A3A1UP78_9BACL|nr:hypothetical protein D3P08_21640 [Paenibacillus nanensis]